MTATEVMVRMGEIATSAEAGDVLVSIGLGSCIGLALVDRRATFAGLAHIVLPQAPSAGEAPGKFADVAVPALLERLERLGATAARLDAVLVGGARMFSVGAGGGLDIGSRNEAATRAALSSAGVRVRAAATGGSQGRTVRVHVGQGLVTVKEAGGCDEPLLARHKSEVGVDR